MKIRWRIPLAILLAASSAVGGGIADVESDADGDRVADSKDRCARTPAGATADRNGCTLIQLANGGGRVVLEPAMKRALEAKAMVAMHEELTQHASGMEAALMTMDRASTTLIFDGLCAGAGRFREGLSAFEGAVNGIDATVRALLPALLRKNPEVDHGDTDADDAKADDLELAASLARRALNVLTADADAMTGPCDAIVRRDTRFEGRVNDVDDSRGIATLADGTVVAIPRNDPDLILFESGIATGRGSLLVDGSIWPDSMTTKPDGFGAAIGPLPVKVPVCLGPRIAPYQPAWGGVPPLLHPVAGYDRQGAVWLEAGMAVTAADECVPDEDPGLPVTIAQPGPSPSAPSVGTTFLERSFAALITFDEVATGDRQIWYLAIEHKPGDEPLQIPDELSDPSFAKKLHLITAEGTRTCMLVALGQKSCGSYTWTETVSSPLVLLPSGAYCSVAYANTMFAMDEDDFNAHGITKVTAAHTPLLAQPEVEQIEFAAKAFTVHNGQSQAPVSGQIGIGDLFAIHWHEPGINIGIGTENRSGLVWPHVKGTASGEPFRYSCAVPKVIRDVVTFCHTDAEHSYYRIPFGPGFRQVGHANATSPTHVGSQAYALDFPDQMYKVVRAARGGEVWLVVDDQSANCYPQGGCSANRVVIKHADGSYATYRHLPENGSLVDIGDTVKRGDPIGLVGNSGYSAEPHLHFEVQSVYGGATIRARYEYRDTNMALRTCAIPATGATVYSTNG